MSNLPNPGTIRTTFDTYAEAQGASILAPVSRIFVGELCYARDAQGTALTTRGGITWSPQGQATLAHWNVTGTAYLLEGAFTYPVPTVDDTARIQAAIDWCLARGRDLHGDPSRIYGVTGRLFFGARTGNSAQANFRGGCKLADVNLAVIGGTWASGTITGTNPDNWTFGDAVLNVGSHLVNNHRVVVERVYVDCRYVAPTGIRWQATTVALLSNVHVDRPLQCGIEVGQPNVSNRSPTDSVLENVRVRGNPFGTPGYDDFNLRTQYGLVVRTSDFNVRGGLISTCKVNFVLGGGFNVQVTDLVSWSGKPETPGTVNAIVSEAAAGYRIVGCRFEDGHTQIRGFDGTVIGCYFNQFNNPLQFIATAANETATELVFVGNKQRGGSSTVSLLTEGGGSWGQFAAEWIGNQRDDGASLTVQDIALSQGYWRVKTTGVMRAAAMTPPSSSADPGTPAEFGFGSDGRIYWYAGGQWRRTEGVTF